MIKVVFECETCGFKKIANVQNFSGKLSDLVNAETGLEVYRHTHMCDTGRVEVIDGVVEEELKHSDVCPLEHAYKDEPDLYSLDDGEPV